LAGTIARCLRKWVSDIAPTHQRNSFDIVEGAQLLALLHFGKMPNEHDCERLSPCIHNRPLVSIGGFSKPAILQQ
jgi:hypothetical protein